MIIVLLTTGFPEDETLFARPAIQTDCDEIAKCGRWERRATASRTGCSAKFRMSRSLG
jgi:hypothetical protein